MFGIGMTELMVVFVVGLVVLGPKRLPSLARSLGRTLAEFRHASNDLRRDFMDVSNSIDLNGSLDSKVGDEAEEQAASDEVVPAPTQDDQDAEDAVKHPHNDEGTEPKGG